MHNTDPQVVIATIEKRYVPVNSLNKDGISEDQNKIFFILSKDDKRLF